MSDTPFSGLRGGNGLMPMRAPAPVAPAAAAPRFNHRVPMAHTRHVLAGNDQDAMIRKRDAMGDVMNELRKVANAPENNRADIAAYIGGMIRKGIITQDESAGLLSTLPEDQDGMRQWARAMFTMAMNTSIHAHAAYPREVFPGGNGAEASQAPAEQGGESAVEAPS